jgi:predicted DNA-binding protein (MmcQ/YjbR family)
MHRNADVLGRMRQICLGFPEAREIASWGHPNFCAGKRGFAAFELINGRPSIAFRLGSFEMEAALRSPLFFATPYGRGRWISIWADGSLDWRLVEDLLRRSYKEVALKRMLVALEGS